MDSLITRDPHGRFVKGISGSPDTEFKKGQHWRPKKSFWEYSILFKAYITDKKTVSEIASSYGVTGSNIRYFLRKHKIPTRTISETRKIKHWGAAGDKNGMFGKFGKQNPNWNGGHSPERQSMYARSMWKEIKKLVLKRDSYQCVQCTQTTKLIVHHILHWSRYPKYRFTESNLMTLCVECHKKIHSKQRGEN